MSSAKRKRVSNRGKTPTTLSTRRGRGRGRADGGSDSARKPNTKPAKRRKKAQKKQPVYDFSRDALKNAYSLFDVDQDGVLSLENIVSCASDAEHNLSFEDIQDMLQEADRVGDNDGIVTIGDFMAICTYAGICPPPLAEHVNIVTDDEGQGNSDSESGLQLGATKSDKSTPSKSRRRTRKKRTPSSASQESSDYF
jgi:hypothetical protein